MKVMGDEGFERKEVKNSLLGSWVPDMHCTVIAPSLVTPAMLGKLGILRPPLKSAVMLSNPTIDSYNETSCLTNNIYTPL